jgi:hypothetical protein
MAKDDMAARYFIESHNASDGTFLSPIEVFGKDVFTFILSIAPYKPDSRSNLFELNILMVFMVQ